MRKYVRSAHVAAGLFGGAMMALSGVAAAQTVPACPTDANAVYVSGSSAAQPLILALSKVLGSSVEIVYQSPGSCQGLEDLVDRTASDAAYLIKPTTTAADIKSGNAACTLPANDAGVGAAPVDIAASDVYASTCHSGYMADVPTTGGMPGWGDFQGPVQAMAFIQSSKAMKQHTISAEAAYMVFGFGAKAGQTPIAPWTVTSDIFVRKNDSGTLQMLGTAIGLLGNKWQQGTTTTPSVVQATGTGDLVSKMAALNTTGTSTDWDGSIGILSTSGLTPDVQPIAFQGKGQTCSYYPSSTASKTDLINVREGRYVVWGPEHFVTSVDSSGNPVGMHGNTAAVQAFINAATATAQAPAVTSDAGTGAGLTEQQIETVIDAISPPSTGFIPTCAMRVKRTAEIGQEMSYAPPAACVCRFEQGAPGSDGGASGTGAGSPNGHTCTACGSASDCSGATPKCRFGYCEAE